MPEAFQLKDIARFPAPGDNAVIATRDLKSGTVIRHGGNSFALSHTVLEGHRFTVSAIPKKGRILSWGLPFGVASRAIKRGEYLMNAMMLDALKLRRLKFALPSESNFVDHQHHYVFDPDSFAPSEQVPRYERCEYFDGFQRPGGRGVGTRNYIVVLGTTSLTAGYARALAQRFDGISADYPNIDGVVPVAHTEGGTPAKPNNIEYLLRTLAGFIVHPNVGAVLAVDVGSEYANNRRLQEFLGEHNYGLKHVVHCFKSMKQGFLKALDEGESIVKSWLAPVNSFARSRQSVEHLKVAQQCGGSDAFSGVSGNPLSGWVTKELIRHGGSANLGETSELIGAESYVLQNVRSRETAERFLQVIDRFQTWAGWHGHSAYGNPSGGNLFRGLYNIVVKSIGAANKKDPEVRLDYVIDFAERMIESGYYFMDSAGNDLECIAGQVAAGCNLIHFITGNGSITNFPFVPTIKIVTTSGRYELLRNEMDVNAGRYLDGMPLDELGRETFDLTIKVASGQQSVGEKAGHSQVQLWREWRQTDDSKWKAILAAPKPTGKPLSINAELDEDPLYGVTVNAYPTANGFNRERIGLIVPTSLCSGQIAKMIADRLNARPGAERFRHDLDRYVALPHTEGCGAARGLAETMFMQTLTGYVRHPAVNRCLLLEHGCEKTHNDEMRHFLEEEGVDPDELGWASVQLDGGIDSVIEKVVGWFDDTRQQEFAESTVPQKRFSVGLVADAKLPAMLGEAMAILAKSVLKNGGTFVMPGGGYVSQSSTFSQALGLDLSDAKPSLGYGQTIIEPGFHLMDTPTDHQVETITGLAATGVHIVLAFVTQSPLEAHPITPVLQITVDEPGEGLPKGLQADIDIVLDSDSTMKGQVELIATRLRATLNGNYVPKMRFVGNFDLQITRGALGLTL